MSVANLIDWDNFTGQPIVRSESEQQSLNTLFAISESTLNFKRSQLFKPVSYNYVGQENGTEAFKTIIIPEYFEKHLENYRKDKNKQFLYQSDVIVALGNKKIPSSFKIYYMNRATDKEIFFS